MTMTKTQVLALLKKSQNERGIANWKKLGVKTGKRCARWSRIL